MAGAKEKGFDRDGFSRMELLKKTKTIKRLLKVAKFILTSYKQNWPQKAAGCGRHPLLTFPRFYC
jgi:hypothetical protein